MTFLELHNKGQLFLLNLDSIVSVEPKLKGTGSLITVHSEESPYEADQTIEQIQEIMTILEVEFLDCANDG